MSRDRQDRVTIPEAASRLGITQAAVRQRIRRGSISWEKGEDRRTYVYLSPDVTARHTVDDTSRDELIEELRDRVRSLEEQIARRDAIMLSLTESLRQLEAPREARESSETAEPQSGEPAPTEPAEGSQEAAQERISWVALIYNLLAASVAIGFLYFVVVFASYYLYLDATLVAGIGVVGTLGAAWLIVYLTRRARRTR